MRASTVALALAASALAASASPPVRVSLETGWAAPPLVLEILETVYDEYPSSYFQLLHLLSSLPPDSTDESILSSTLDLIQAYSLLPSPSSLSTFHLALSLHSTAPRIEAQYNWYNSAVKGQENKLGVEGCEGWVEWRGKGFCDVDGLKRDMEMSIEEGIHKINQEPHSLPFDRTFSSASSTSFSPRAIFYYAPFASTSNELLGYLDHHASHYPEFTYTVRYQSPLSDAAKKPLSLSGWGAEMALKKMDYLVVDDRATGKITFQNEGDEVARNESNIFAHVFGNDPWSDQATPLTATEIRDIGLKAATLIMSSDDPISALTHLSQDFPKYSAALAHQVEVPEDIQSKGRTIAVRGKAKEAIYINGKPFDRDLNPYTLLKALRDERQLTISLTSLGLTPKQSIDILADPVVGQGQIENDMGEGLVDASDRIEGGDVITYWNDIEKDKRYHNWPIHPQGYMRPVYPGQFHNVRRNTFNLIFALDLSRISSLELIVHSISTMIQRGLPIRFGIVPVFEPEQQDDISLQMAKVFWYSVKTFGRSSTRDFFAAIIDAIPRQLNNPAPQVNDDVLRKGYDALSATSIKASLAFDDVLTSDDWDHHIEKAGNYLKRLLITKKDTENGGMFMNGRFTPNAPTWPNIVTQEMQSQLAFIQEQVMLDAIPEDISTMFYDLPATSKRRSSLVIPVGDNKLKVFNLVDLFKNEGIEGKLSGEFVYPDGERGTPISMWIIGDLDSPEGLEIVKNGLQHLQTPQCASRLGFIHVPPASRHSSCPAGQYCFSTVLYQILSQNALSLTKPSDLLELISEVQRSVKTNLEKAGEINVGNQEVDDFGITFTLSPEDQQKYFEAKPLHSMTFGGWVAGDTAAASEFWKAGTQIAGKLAITDGVHLLVNGRLVGPITPVTFPLDDFEALEAYEHRKRVKPIIDVLKTMYDDITAFDRPTLANLISKASSVVTAAYKPLDGEGIFAPAQSTRTRYYERLDDGSTSFKLGDEDMSLLKVAVVVNPLSEQAQKWSPLIQTLSEMDHVFVSVYLEPEALMEEVKLKRFYRTSVPSRLTFDVDGAAIAPGLTFNDLPSNPIYTLGLDTPPSWIVSPRTSPYDLDNLLLSSTSSPVAVTFQLKQLLIEGHARESGNIPPRGLQLQLKTLDGDIAADTQVMANLGYLQFRATPGYYTLSIRPGRGEEVFNLESIGAEGWDSPSVGEVGDGVSLSSFDGETIYPRFARKEGMEKADVLQESIAAPEGLAKQVYSRMKSIVGLSTKVTPAKSEHADINIFTVASGLLYERFASIMILSVMKHTNSSVKFWFIENFLSPTFITFIPKLAEEYGFQYEFVTYKWPHWLRAQTEKQRIIWAYKILFLDVLFPMSLDKVIFVDADQIVRTDMKELVDVDLHGRVYGYAPMGNSRKEMEGFRFWKSGYWKEALRGRPYHISALYVVDLKKFRQLATGDRLRGQYHALSADPNSLANLDQDLPNSMQDQIPIWTLDQDWLWCQTWCSDESLATAKTIDLCQNPLTKEPKLVRARQIPEWDAYDQEIAAFAARVSEEGEESGALAISVDYLASERHVSGVEGKEGETEREAEGRIGDEL
ncbi:UDP-glucose:glycoprotein glucosyltransferase [Cryptococcus neoformans]|nr:UDP-glucose:glycoprotein glucosyltransferase [Cryptococcus neoformans var. grubii Th84]OXH16908.1 UDP-glucose:glycoprotein glucosyltransferase [Cryptococcus neoformans var. grubii]OXH37001.1 UDP-glucose:glycoprotein glucosyltransferase [Cryptococcus neoformans var. grubii]OXH58029.1 UDP-glucose:glycoprotein glucosyltransferase [Cryptococcus neoformans var. grubii]OXH58293.1 UDP-glucose:glycoprotein glucosyltransferase [Cryptococcus neoformans var. grubii]